MKESDLSRKVVRFCQSVNCMVFNVHGHRMQQAGIPDLFVMHNKLPNKGVWIELKVGGNKCSEIQRYTMRELHRRGQIAMVLRAKNELFIIENVDGNALFVASSIRALWEGLVV